MPKQFIGQFDQSMLEDAEEFNKRYKDTFLWLSLQDKPHELFYCHGYTNDNGVKFSNKDVGNIYLDHKTEVNIEVRWPEPKLFNTDNTFAYVTRIPERQWKRAPANKNIWFIDPIAVLMKHTSIGNPNFKLLQDSYKPTQKQKILEGINALKKSDLCGITLTNKFAISLPPFKASSFILWYNTSPIAIIFPKEKTIALKYEYIQQELQDFIRDHEESAWTII